MDLFEIYCSERELAGLFRAKRRKPVSALRALKSAALNPQSIPSYLQTDFWDEDDSEQEAEQEARLLDYELARAKAHLAKVVRWERDIQRKAPLHAPAPGPRSHRTANTAALRDIKG
jgi:hypothetical protein